MVVRVIVGLMLWVGAAACGLSWTLTVWRMIDQVNARLPPGKRFRHIAWWWFGKTLSLFEEYERHFPNSPHRRRLRLLNIAGAIIVAGLLADLYPIILR